MSSDATAFIANYDIEKKTSCIFGFINLSLF